MRGWMEGVKKMWGWLVREKRMPRTEEDDSRWLDVAAADKSNPEEKTRTSERELERCNEITVNMQMWCVSFLLAGVGDTQSHPRMVVWIRKCHQSHHSRIGQLLMGIFFDFLDKLPFQLPFKLPKSESQKAKSDATNGMCIRFCQDIGWASRTKSPLCPTPPHLVVSVKFQ